MRKRFLFFVLCILIVVSCKKEKKGLIVALSSEPETLDLHSTSTLTSRIIASGNIFERLFYLDNEGEIKSELSSSYYFENDGKKLVIELKEGILFSDGNELKSEDVVSSLNRYLSRYKASSDLVGEESFFKEESPYRVSIESENNITLFPLLLSFSPVEPVIMKKEVLDKEDSVVTTIIGTGPYKVESWKRGEEISLVKNTLYNGEKKTEEERITFRFIKDPIIRRLSLESGEVDVINDAMSQDFDSYRKNEKIELIKDEGAGHIAIVFNKNEGIGKNLDFRRGVSLALDKNALMASCYGKEGYETYPTFMEKNQISWKTDGVNEYFLKDEKRAGEFLRKYKDEKVRLLTPNFSNLDKIALEAAYELEKVGLKVEILSLDWASFIEKRKDKESWDLYISAFSSVPLPSMKTYFSPAFPGGLNEELFNEILSIYSFYDLKKVKEKWNEIEKELFNYVPSVVLGHYDTYYAAKKEIPYLFVSGGVYFWEREND